MPVSLTEAQQKRLLAAELAKQTQACALDGDVIALAERWLEFIEGPEPSKILKPLKVV